MVGCFAVFAAVVGIAIADLSLAPAALVVLTIYAVMNIFFSRMIAVWLERWLATRRAREIFGVLMAFFFVGIQVLNFRHTMGQGHRGSGGWILTFVEGTNPALTWFPPGFATQAIILTAHPLERLIQFAALLLWTAVFFAAFAIRLHKQFLGEFLSEGAPRSTVPRRRIPTPAPAAVFNQQLTTSNQQLLSPTIAACLRKEWVYLRGNGNQLVAMLMPLVFVFILSRGVLARHPEYLLPGSVGYAVMGLLAALYNIFGADGAGVQFYLLAPVRLRDVILAKNIASMALLLAEVALAWCVVFVLTSAPIPVSAQLSAAFWIIFILFTNLTVGTLRSIQSPRKITLGQVRKMRTTPASKTSGLLVLAILLGSILLQIPVTLLCKHFHNPWLAVWIFAPLAAAAIAAYAQLLNNADRLVLTYRDVFAQELCGD
jgi:ABC-2 type transport system permease protein